jgi:hypothetical protein
MTGYLLPAPLELEGAALEIALGVALVAIEGVAEDFAVVVVD